MVQSILPTEMPAKMIASFHRHVKLKNTEKRKTDGADKTTKHYIQRKTYLSLFWCRFCVVEFGKLSCAGTNRSH